MTTDRADEPMRVPRTAAPDKAGAADRQPEPPRKPLAPAAKRALAEAEARRKAREAVDGQAPKEIGGQTGPDPIRYGDWEKDGICSDF